MEEIRRDYSSACQFTQALRICLEELTEDFERNWCTSGNEEAKLDNDVAVRKQIVDNKRKLEKEISKLPEVQANNRDERTFLVL